MKYQKLININIKNIRVSNNLTQEEFAEKIGISIQGLSNIERNRYQPSAETIDKICSAFDITPAELLVSPNPQNEDILSNIITLLSQCSQRKLAKIYNIISLIIKL